MSGGNHNLAFYDARREARDEVQYPARAFGPDAQELDLLLLNLSPHGMMARCAEMLDEGARVRLAMPIVGLLVGEVRWAQDGRMGFQFETAIDLASYYELLAQLVRE